MESFSNAVWQVVAGYQQSAEQELGKDEGRRELAGLKLRASERGCKQPERGAGEGVGKRDGEKLPHRNVNVHAE